MFINTQVTFYLHISKVIIQSFLFIYNFKPFTKTFQGIEGLGQHILTIYRTNLDGTWTLSTGKGIQNYEK